MTRVSTIITQLKEIELRDGVLTPSAVVNLAKDSNHPLHNVFEWNDTIAGEKYRLVQARQLINEFTVKINDRKTEAFHNVTVMINNVPTRGYVSRENVANKAGLVNQLKRRAVQEIEYWRAKYDELSELSNVVNEEEVERIKDTLTD